MQVNLKGLRAVIVGGAGFIGHNLALHLKSLGVEVSIVDGLEVNNLVSLAANADNVPNPQLSMALVNLRLSMLREQGIPVYVQDARDYHALSHVLHGIKPDAILHLAAVSHADRSNKNPYSTFDHSLRTLENALDYARGANVKQFIYLSSSMVYGNFNGQAVTEESNCNPIGIYGALKLCGETIVKSYNQVFDLPYTIIRPSALYGERCVSRRVGQVFIENALCGKPIYLTGDGSDQLDFTYIADLVQGITLCLARERAKNQTFNLTYGSGRAIRELADIIKEEFPDIQIGTRSKDNFTPERGTLSVDKARRLLDYQPAFPVDRGYRDYVKWYKGLKTSQPHLFA
jgi:nucleoside-diphosphate-sugar epimerase